MASYSLTIPFHSTADVHLELPEGLTEAEVIERIAIVDISQLDIDNDAIAAAVNDSVVKLSPNIQVRTN